MCSVPGNNSAVDVIVIEVNARTIDVGWMKPDGNLNGNLTGFMITWEGNGASESINLTNETYKVCTNFITTFNVL